MKKIFALLLVLTMVLSLVACGKKASAGSDGSDIGVLQADPDAAQPDTPDEEQPDMSAGSGKGGILTEDGECTQKQMEDTIVSYLSKAGDVSSLTLCGGSSIDYTAAFIMSVDTWQIYDPTMEWEELRDSIDAQLSPAGFVMDDKMVVFGPRWTAMAGEEPISFDE